MDFDNTITKSLAAKRSQTNRTRKCTYAPVILALLLSGCASVGPNYEEPKIPTPDAWSQSISKQTGEQSTDLTEWWKGLNDPTLNKLIERARSENPNLRLAAERVQESLARRGIARSQFFPNVEASGAYSRARFSDNSFSEFPDAVQQGIPNETFDYYSGGFDVGWEMDVFGGVRRAVEASEAGMDVSGETYRDVLVTLFAEVARNYVEYRSLQERIRLAYENVEAQERSVQIAKSRLESGLRPETDVTQAKTNLESSRSFIPILKTQLSFIQNTLAVLVGGYSESIEDELKQTAAIPAPPSSIEVGLPTDLLRSRPDVRAAERRLATQTALIGVAAADLYPRFRLFGSFNLESVDSSDFFDSDSRAYAFGPSVRWNIFSAGRIRNTIAVQESRTEQALATYENTVLVAVAEVESSMAALKNETDRNVMLNKAVTSSVKTVDLLKANYENGLINFQPLLDAQRVKFTIEDSAAASKGLITQDYIRLYKALGGGSQVEVVPIPPQKAQKNESLLTQAL